MTRPFIDRRYLCAMALNYRGTWPLVVRGRRLDTIGGLPETWYTRLACLGESMVRGGAASVLTWLCPIAGAAAPCSGQETITFEVRVSDLLLTPGETQHIEVWATLAPGHGTLVPWGTTGTLGTVMGFGGADLGVQNVAGAETGDWSGLALNPSVAWWGGTAGQAMPGGGVAGIKAHQFPISVVFSQANPILLWSADWDPLGYEPRTVELSTEVTVGPYAYLDLGGGMFVSDTWTPAYVPGSFAVVPATPSISVLIGAAALVARGRRRHESSGTLS